MLRILKLNRGGFVVYNCVCYFQDTNFDTPLGNLDDDQISQMKFYNAKVHAASFALPEFVRKAVDC